MLITHFALISKAKVANFSELTRVSSAIQKQLIRDVAPIWGKYATIDAFDRIEDVPYGYHIIDVVAPQGNSNILGFHTFNMGFPTGTVNYAPDLEWSLTASHECLEMLINPHVNEYIVGDLPYPDFPVKRVAFCVEICDPCQHIDNAYTCNGLRVSDFITPDYFSPLVDANIRGSFSGKITKPRTLLPGGYQIFRVLMEDKGTNEIVKEIWEVKLPKSAPEGDKPAHQFYRRFPQSSKSLVAANTNDNFESPYFNVDKFVADSFVKNKELVTQNPDKEVVKQLDERKSNAEKNSKQYAKAFKAFWEKLLSKFK